MPDYDLGRAHGRVVIDADTRGAAQAQAAMAGLAAESKVLDTALGRVRDRFGENSKEYRKASAEIDLQRTKIRQIKEEYDKLASGIEAVRQIRVAAQRDFDRINDRDFDAVRQRQRLQEIIERSKEKEADLIRRSERIWNQYELSVRRAARSVANFGDGQIEVHRNIRRFNLDLSLAARQVGNLANVLSTTLLTAFKAVGLIGGVGIGGGAVGLAGGGLLQGLTVGVGAAAEAVRDFSGVLLLLPAAISGVLASVATLAVGFRGIGEALSSFDDPKKFAESLRELAPAAREAMIILQSFRDVFRGAMQEVQQSLFEPIVDQIEPLIRTWLPALMEGGKALASTFGEVARVFAMWLQQPRVVAAFQEFIQNLASGIQAMLPAMQSFAEAWLTLTTVGGQALPRIAEFINNIVGAFNEWVQDASSRGKLLEWIDRAFDAFEQTWRIVVNLFDALGNIGDIASKFSGGFLDTIEKITEQFRLWTESTQGQAALTIFFSTLKETGDAFLPVLKSLSGAFGDLIIALLEMGTSIAPGLESFLNNLGDAIKILGDAFVQSGPAFNTFLTAFGEFIEALVSGVGPQLPQLFQTLADVLVDLAPVLSDLATALSEFLANLSPEEVKVILAVVVGLKGLAAVMTTLAGLAPGARLLALALGPLITLLGNPVVLAVVAIGALVAAVILAYQNIEEFRNFVDGAIDAIGKFASTISNTVLNALRNFSNFMQGVAQSILDFGGNVINAVTEAFNNVVTFFQELPGRALNWGRDLIQGLIDGIRERISEVGEAAADVAQAIADFITPGSPTKKGPLSKESTESMGARLVSGFATGVASGEPAVTSAARSVAGGAASGFTSAGLFAGGTGTGASSFAPSGLNQAVKSITQDLALFNDLFRNIFGLFKDVSETIVDAIEITATLWNRGNNPLNRALQAPQGQRPQQTIPGIVNAPPPVELTVPRPELLPPEHQGVPQQSVPGVPSVPPPGQVQGQAPAGTQGQAPPSGIGPLIGPSGEGVKPPSATPKPTNAPRQSAPGDAPLVAALKQKGFSDEMIRLIQAFSVVEGNNPAGNPTLGWTDAQLGGDTSLQGHVDALAQQFKDRESVAGPFPAGGSDREQAQWIANVVGQAGLASDWQGNAQPQDYVQRVVDEMQKISPAPQSTGGGSIFGPGASGDVNPQTGLTDEQATAILYGQAPPEIVNNMGNQTIAEKYFPGRDPSTITPIEALEAVAKEIGGSDIQSTSTVRNEPGSFHDVSSQQAVDFDFAGDPKEADARLAQFANKIGVHFKGVTEELIFRGGGFNEQRNILGRDFVRPGAKFSESTVAQHGGSNSHVHWAIGKDGVPVLLGFTANAPNAPQSTDELGRPLFGPAAAGTPQAFPEPDPNAPLIGPAAPGNPRAFPQPGPDAPLFGDALGAPQTTAPHGFRAGQLPGPQSGLNTTPSNQPSQGQSPISQFQSVLSSVSSIAGDAFQVFDDVLKSIDATADITDQLVRGFANTQDVSRFIDDVQQFIKTAASVAKLVGSIGGVVAGIGGATSAADFGGTAAAGQAIQAVAGVVQGALEATNAAIDIGQQVFQIVGKFGAIFAGNILGNGQTGPLAGDVRLLLNTRTGDIQAFSLQNPDNKNNINLPSFFDRAYGGTRPELDQRRPAQVNIYAGPGQTPQAMMSESMWLASTGHPAVASVAGSGFE